MIKKLKYFSRRFFTSKGLVCEAVSRFLPKSFGKLEDIDIDSIGKNIRLFFELDGLKSTMEIKNYSVEQEQRKGFVTFEHIVVDGYLTPLVDRAVKNKKIEIDQKYVNIVKKLLKT